ncbi:MAG: hypothetical protein Q8P40_14595 [Nitrospirota bacterium]|nr:hypothetical protein [Nitrospirota bacterium]
MRQYDLNTGGVRIVIVLEVIRMDRWTIYNDPVWEAVTIKVPCHSCPSTESLYKAGCRFTKK